MDEKVSGRKMCEIISSFFKEKHGIEKSWEEIWNYSPTGELYNVYYWYEDALDWFKNKDKNGLDTSHNSNDGDSNESNDSDRVVLPSGQ
jgi:hypothetical protein